jgi:hypothetical protein
MSKDYNMKDKNTEGPGKHWSPNSVGDYKRGYQDTNQKNVESEHRKGAGAKQ